MRRPHEPPAEPDAAGRDADELVVSPDLANAAARRATVQGRAARALRRAVDRRRIVPATVVGTLAVIGVGLADAGIQRTIPTTSATLVPVTTIPTNSQALSELDAAAKVLGADQAALSQLQQSAAVAVPLDVGPTGAVPSSSTASATGVSGAAATAHGAGATAGGSRAPTSPTPPASVPTSVVSSPSGSTPNPSGSGTSTTTAPSQATTAPSQATTAPSQATTAPTVSVTTSTVAVAPTTTTVATTTTTIPKSVPPTTQVTTGASGV